MEKAKSRQANGHHHGVVTDSDFLGVRHDTPSVLNYRSFDFFYPKFNHSSYSKIYVKHHFFCYGLLYQYKFFKSDLNLTMFVQIF